MPTLVGFNYLKNPAHPYARELIRAGELGDITLFRGTFDQDLQADPDFPFTWRHERAVAGSGTLGDMASHTLAFAQYLVGDTVEVCGMCETFIRERPVAASGTGQTSRARPAAPRRTVENDDVTQFLMRFANGAIGTIGSSRIGTGRKLGLGYEIQGTKGALLFTQERMNELKLYRHTDPSAERGYKTVYIGPDLPNYAAFHPLPGIGLGYNDQKIIEARELIVAVAEGRPARARLRLRPQDHPGDRRGAEVGRGAPLGAGRGGVKLRISLGPAPEHSDANAAIFGLRTVASCRSDSRIKLSVRAAVAPVLKPLPGVTRFDIGPELK